MPSKARAAEAVGERIRFTYNDQEYEVGGSDTWPVKVIRLFEDERPMAALRIILGDQQYETFEESCSFADLEGFMASLSEATGANPTR